jgi:hypothetical protein
MTNAHLSLRRNLAFLARAHFSIRWMLAAAVLVVALLAGSCRASSERLGGSSSLNRPDRLALTIVETPTPPLRVAGFDTRGTYPQVKGGNFDLRAVNRALRAAVLADQRGYAPFARSVRKGIGHPPVGKWRGLYQTKINPELVSASTVVVSALLWVRRAPALTLLRGPVPLGMTVRVPSGVRVTIADLFANPRLGLRIFGEAWRAKLRRDGSGDCLGMFPEIFAASVSNYRQFALTSDGLAVGVAQGGRCGPYEATVGYGVLRPYLSKLGAKLVAGVRRPRLERAAPPSDGSS